MLGKITIRNGVVYFGIGSFHTEGKYLTTYWRLGATASQIVEGEGASWPDNSPCVKPDHQLGDHINSVAWRVCNADGSFADSPQSHPARVL